MNKKLCPHCYKVVSELIEFNVGQIVKSKSESYFKENGGYIPKGLTPNKFYKIDDLTEDCIWTVNDYGENDNFIIEHFETTSYNEILKVLNKDS